MPAAAAVRNCPARVRPVAFSLRAGCHGRHWRAQLSNIEGGERHAGKQNAHPRVSPQRMGRRFSQSTNWLELTTGAVLGQGGDDVCPPAGFHRDTCRRGVVRHLRADSFRNQSAACLTVRPCRVRNTARPFRSHSSFPILSPGSSGACAPAGAGNRAARRAAVNPVKSHECHRPQ